MWNENSLKHSFVPNVSESPSKSHEGHPRKLAIIPPRSLDEIVEVHKTGKNPRAAWHFSNHTPQELSHEEPKNDLITWI